MVKQRRNVSRGPPTPAGPGCCRVEAVVGVDDRGQMVLPKEVRDRAGIRAGDKLALVSWEQNGTLCCISLIKAEDLNDMVRGLLGPMMSGIAQGQPGGA